MDNEQIEEKLKKGYLEEGYELWKSRNFEFLNTLSAGSNFYYLRQLLQFSEKRSEDSKIQEKDEEIKNLVSSYETLQEAYERLKLEKNAQQEDFFMSTENFEESEIVKMNEELLEQIDYLETSKAELEGVLRSKVKEFSLEIENFVQISEEKSQKIVELSDLLSEIEEKYQVELEKLRLEHTMIVKKLEDSLGKLENQKNALEEDCKGLQQHKKIYDQSLEEFKDHIQKLEKTISDINSENSRLQVQANEIKSSSDGLLRNFKNLENENSNLVIENQELENEVHRIASENQALIRENQALVKENHGLVQENQGLTQEKLKLQQIAQELKSELDGKCEQVFSFQEEIRELGIINSDQSETIINLNFDLNRFRRQLKSSSRHLDQKSVEVESVRKSLERVRNDYSKESSRLLESCSSKITTKKREMSVQSVKLNALQSSFQSLSYDNESLREKLKTLENDKKNQEKNIEDLLEKNSNLEKSLKTIEDLLNSEYFSLCSSNFLQTSTLDSVPSLLSEFLMIPRMLKQKLSILEQRNHELTVELQSKSDLDRAKTDEVLMKCEQIEYLMNQISYLNEINKGLENQRLACSKLLADFLNEDCLNDFKGLSIVIEKFQVMVKENKALILMVDYEKRKAEEKDQENSKIMQKLEFLQQKLQETENEARTSRNDSEVKNLQVLLREYRKNKQELEKKVTILQKNLADACRLRDVLADELSEKCDIIENLTKSSIYKNFN